MKQSSLKKLNLTLTDRIICLHQKGYTDDFLSINSEKLQCIQNGESFFIDDVRINLVDCGYDILTRSFQYIHTIDTQIGCRGLMILNGILPLYK
ncbi:hypothetical protein ACFOG5_01385 [Pedobacter fastidiosus]|uniref:Uncharacterized protein n=1 Tax=Pedobacter fastidiosus TaxID=2765361 RepID=A0ABR7KS52_9SPHI|nr:hypothetical protein [Pedobacter fastidiosus]MBC6110901.1 hypothetical protein [Pedobacter fastidiosus]